jgi:hypothetical protein
MTHGPELPADIYVCPPHARKADSNQDANRQDPLPANTLSCPGDSPLYKASILLAPSCTSSSQQYHNRRHTQRLSSLPSKSSCSQRPVQCERQSPSRAHAGQPYTAAHNALHMPAGLTATNTNRHVSIPTKALRCPGRPNHYKADCAGTRHAPRHHQRT